MTKGFYAGVVAVIFLAAASLAGTGLQAQSIGGHPGSEAVDQSTLDADYERNAARASVVDPTSQTDIERIHARQYPSLAMRFRGLPIRSSEEFTSGGRSCKRIVGSEVFFSSAEVRRGIARLCATSDAVVTGSIVSRSAQFSAGETFLLTNYSVRVESVLKSQSGPALQSGDLVPVTRMGGVAFIDGVLVETVIAAIGLLDDGDLLLFLKYMPESQSYCTAGSEESLQPLSAFSISDNSLTPQSAASIDTSRWGDARDFVEFVRRSCNGDVDTEPEGPRSVDVLHEKR